MKIVLLGSPGSGKSSLCPVLRERYSICHLHAPELIADAIMSQNRIGLAARAAQSSGFPISDDLKIDAAIEAAKNRADCAKGFVLDGMPTSAVQAKRLTDARLVPDHIIVLNVAKELVIDRLSGRWVHPPSGRIYHSTICPPRKPQVDDYTGEPLVQSAEDSLPAVTKRIDVYEKQLREVREYYGDPTLTDEVVIETNPPLSPTADPGPQKGAALSSDAKKKRKVKPMAAVHILTFDAEHPLHVSLERVTALLDPHFAKERRGDGGWMSHIWHRLTGR